MEVDDNYHFNVLEEYIGDYESHAEFFEHLKDKQLVISWELPELHTIFKHYTRLPTKNDKEGVKKRGIPLKEGHFSSDEDKIVKKNWTSLCKQYDLPNSPEAFARWRDSSKNRDLVLARQFVILWLSRDLPERMPSQVYHHFVHKMGSKTKGRYSEDEMEIINLFQMNASNKVYTQQFLGSILGRDERSIYKRLACIKKDKPENYKKKWILQDYEKLLIAILEVIPNTTEEGNVEHLRNRQISWGEWLKISKKLSITPISAKIQWNKKLYIQLFSSKPIYSKKVIKKLIKIFHEKNYKCWKDINWKHISFRFNTLTPIFLWYRFYHFCLWKVPENMDKFERLIEILYELYIVKDTEIKNFQLRRLIFENGRLIYNPSDIKKIKKE